MRGRAKCCKEGASCKGRFCFMCQAAAEMHGLARPSTAMHPWSMDHRNPMQLGAVSEGVQ